MNEILNLSCTEAVRRWCQSENMSDERTGAALAATGETVCSTAYLYFIHAPPKRPAPAVQSNANTVRGGLGRRVGSVFDRYRTRELHGAFSR